MMDYRNRMSNFLPVSPVERLYKCFKCFGMNPVVLRDTDYVREQVHRRMPRSDLDPDLLALFAPDTVLKPAKPAMVEERVEENVEDALLFEADPYGKVLDRHSLALIAEEAGLFAGTPVDHRDFSPSEALKALITKSENQYDFSPRFIDNVRDYIAANDEKYGKRLVLAIIEYLNSEGIIDEQMIGDLLGHAVINELSVEDALFNDEERRKAA